MKPNPLLGIDPDAQQGDPLLAVGGDGVPHSFGKTVSRYLLRADGRASALRHFMHKGIINLQFLGAGYGTPRVLRSEIETALGRPIALQDVAAAQLAERTARAGWKSPRGPSHPKIKLGQTSPYRRRLEKLAVAEAPPVSGVKIYLPEALEGGPHVAGDRDPGGANL